MRKPGGEARLFCWIKCLCFALFNIAAAARLEIEIRVKDAA
jgi:hypothetical protein